MSSGLQMAEPDEIDWLREQEPDAGLSFLPTGWPAETWVLHGIWEDVDSGPAETLSADRREPGGLFVGDAAGFVSPPTGWRRLRWRELCARIDEPWGTAHDAPPCFSWFPYSRWPEGVLQPTEGSLDHTTGDHLLRVLSTVTPGGPDAECIVWYTGAGFPFGEWSPLTLRGSLRAVFDVARTSDRHAPTPDNVWPIDRSWLLTTDWDLWATRVAGSSEVVGAVEAEPELETLRWSRAAHG